MNRQAFLALLLGILQALWPAQVLAQRDCQQAPDPWVEVVPGVWTWPPQQPADVSVENRGHVITPSVVVDRGEALLIDPGPSWRFGRQVADAIECQLKARLVGIVNTHAHSENVLANVAFAAAIEAGQLPVWASDPTRAGMTARCESCLASLTDRVGPAEMAGTRIVLPTRTLVEGDEIPVGHLRLRVAMVVAGHTEGDLVLWWPDRRVMWAGGLVYPSRLPELAQGQLLPWVAALNRMAAMRPMHVVGVGVSHAREASSSSGLLPPVGGEADALPPDLRKTRSYLNDLYQALWVAMSSGMQANEAAQQLQLPTYADWTGYAERHGFNVLRAWREIEPRWMDAPADAGPPSIVPR